MGFKSEGDFETFWVTVLGIVVIFLTVVLPIIIK